MRDSWHHAQTLLKYSPEISTLFELYPSEVCGGEIALFEFGHEASVNFWFGKGPVSENCENGLRFKCQ